MVVKDLSNSFYPVPKDKTAAKTKIKSNPSSNQAKKGDANTELKTDFCIMPKSTKYSTKRTKKYNERHEVFFRESL